MVSGRSMRTFLLTSRLTNCERLDTAVGTLPSSLSAKLKSFSPWQWNRGLEEALQTIDLRERTGTLVDL